MNNSRSKDLTAALKNAVIDPRNTESLFKTLSGSRVAFGGFGKKVTETPAPEAATPGNGPGDYQKKPGCDWLYLMCFQDSPDDGLGQTVEYVPFFSSLAQAKRLMKKMRLPLDGVSFREAPIQDFFRLVMDMNEEARLDPGDDYTRSFSSEDMLKIIHLSLAAPENELPAFKKLQEEYSRQLAAKIVALRPDGTLPPTMPKVVELAEHCFEDSLRFQPGLKDSKLWPELKSKVALCQVWRMFLALASVLHIMHFRRRDFSRQTFIKETGLALIMPEASEHLPTDPEASLLVTDLIKRELALRFSLLNSEEKILIHGFGTE